METIKFELTRKQTFHEFKSSLTPYPPLRIEVLNITISRTDNERPSLLDWSIEIDGQVVFKLRHQPFWMISRIITNTEHEYTFNRYTQKFNGASEGLFNPSNYPQLTSFLRKYGDEFHPITKEIKVLIPPFDPTQRLKEIAEFIINLVYQVNNSFDRL